MFLAEPTESEEGVELSEEYEEGKYRCNPADAETVELLGTELGTDANFFREEISVNPAEVDSSKQ